MSSSVARTDRRAAEETWSEERFAKEVNEWLEDVNDDLQLTEMW